ncbi:MAG: complex I subunit 5 family protein [bacterium]
MSHLLVFPVVVPLLAIPVGYLFCQFTACRYYPYYLFISILNFLPLGFLAWFLAVEGVVKYNLGGWIFEKGIVLALDPLALLMLILIQIYFCLAIIFSGAEGNFDPRHFFVLLFLGQAGLSGMVLTSDLFNMYVFLEIASISFYALVAFKRTPEGLEGGFKYLIMGATGGFITLWGIGLVYSVTGNLNLAYLAGEFPSVSPVIKVAVLALFTVGFLLKVGIFPLHAWKADALTGAPLTVNLLLVGIVAKVPLYCLLRIYSLVFGWGFLTEVGLPALLATFAVITILVGHLMALQQENLKRLLAYSSVAHIGYIVAAVATMLPEAIDGALFHVVNHGVMKGGLFLITGALVMSLRTDKIEEMRGLHYRNPFLSVTFVILALGMIGLPPVNGFLSKWQMVVSTMKAGFYISSFTIIFGGFLALIYYSRIMVIFFDTSISDNLKQADFSYMDLHLKLSIFFLVAASLLLFIGADPIFRLISSGGNVLFQTEPYVNTIIGAI